MFFRIILFIILSMGVFSANLDAYQKKSSSKDESSESGSKKKAYGFEFDLPEDYPIRKVNGIVKPAPISEYVALKIKKVNDRIDELEKRLEDLEEKAEEASEENRD